MQRTVSHFAAAGRQPLTFCEKLEFVNFWYLLIVFNDFLTIAGCFLKILIENKVANFSAHFLNAIVSRIFI